MNRHYSFYVNKAKNALKNNPDNIRDAYFHICNLSDQVVPEYKRNDFKLLISKIQEHMYDGKIINLSTNEAESIINLFNSL